MPSYIEQLKWNSMPGRDNVDKLTKFYLLNSFMQVKKKFKNRRATRQINKNLFRCRVLTITQNPTKMLIVSVVRPNIRM